MVLPQLLMFHLSPGIWLEREGKVVAVFN